MFPLLLSAVAVHKESVGTVFQEASIKEMYVIITA